MKAFIECTKGTKEKKEISPDRMKLITSRMLKRAWAANYGFIPGTLQDDNDELDVYIIGKKEVPFTEVEVFPIALVYLVDNGEIDNKLIAASTSAHPLTLKYNIRKVAHFIRKYKKNCKILSVTYSSEAIKYELAKRKAMYKIFRGGDNC